jgi:hypothetical protein
VGRDLCRGQERGEAGPRTRAQPLQPELHDRAVLPQHGSEIRHGPDRSEIREIERGVAKEEPGQRERDAAAGEPAVRIRRVVAMRIHDREGRRQHRGHVVVIRDQDVDPGRVRGGHLVDARRPGVDRDDDRRTSRPCRLDGRPRQPMALLEPGRDVWNRPDAEPAQRQRQDRQPGDPVGIEVAKDEDLLARLLRAQDPGPEDLRVR